MAKTINLHYQLPRLTPALGIGEADLPAIPTTGKAGINLTRDKLGQ
jgi:hypothetical protein